MHPFVRPENLPFRLPAPCRRGLGPVVRVYLILCSGETGGKSCGTGGEVFGEASAIKWMKTHAASVAKNGFSAKSRIA